MQKDKAKYFKVIALLKVILVFVFLFVDKFYIYKVDSDTFTFSYFEGAFGSNIIYSGNTYSVFSFSYVNVIPFFLMTLTILLMFISLFQKRNPRLLKMMIYFTLMLAFFIIFFSRSTLVIPNGEHMILDVGSSFWFIFLLILAAVLETRYASKIYIK